MTFDMAQSSQDQNTIKLRGVFFEPGIPRNFYEVSKLVIGGRIDH
jgi:hypothetical protein